MAYSVAKKYDFLGVSNFKYATDPIPDPTGDAIDAGLIRDSRISSMKADNSPLETATRLPKFKVIGGG